MIGKLLDIFKKSAPPVLPPMPNNASINPGAWSGFLELLKVNGNIQVTPDAAGALPVALYCIDKISSVIASNPHVIYKKNAHGREHASDHDQYRLVNERPNGFTSQSNFAKQMIGLMLKWGNSYARIYRDDNDRPVGYYIWHPRYVDIYSVDGVPYFYNWLLKEGVLYNDMFHMYETEVDPQTFKAIGRIKLAEATFEESLSYAAFRKAFIKNGTHLGYGVTFAGSVKQDQADVVEAKLEAKHGGISKGGSNIVLGQGAEIKPLGMPLKDAQMLETLEKQGIDIGMIFGFKPGQIGSKQGESFNSLEQYNIEFLQYPILPVAKVYMQEMNAKIFRTSEAKTHCMEIDFNGMLQGSVKDRVELYKAMKPALTLNDILEREGMNTFKGGDVRIADLNTTTLENLKRIPSPGQDKMKELSDHLLSEIKAFQKIKL